jgi:glycerol-3-phosphate cytidylyltransferase
LQLDPSKTRFDKLKPSQSIVERQIQLSAVKYVDEIILYESENDLENIFKSLKIDIRIIGEEYKNKNFTGKEICEERNIEIYYNSRKHDYSSTNLKKSISKGK